ncbi:MAG: CoA activase [Myxococcales bacterium]|nr:CoA activase [Myxococcales bacterium]
MKRYLGIDIGAETIKVAELRGEPGAFTLGRLLFVEHQKSPARRVIELLAQLDWPSVAGAAATGRLSRLLQLPQIPPKGAQTAGLAVLLPELPSLALVSIGSHGFSVLELRQGGSAVYRENSRCSQGTGNFLRQLVERFDLGVEEASALCADVHDPAPLSGRCPVILKTDMTHLANKGESRERILAGLYDAVCENVQVLIKPSLTPADVVLGGGVTRAPRIRANFRRFLETNGMRLVEPEAVDALFIDAVGAAAEAARSVATHSVSGSPKATAPRPIAGAAPRPAERALPPLDALVARDLEARFDRVPSLHDSLDRVHRLGREELRLPRERALRLLLGFDIGSTGSKIVALDLDRRQPVWESYTNTSGNPIGAAQQLMRRFLEENAAGHDVLAYGATGSGREIVGSLLSSCYGSERVFVLNEIAAHARGATFYDPAVDTIFEIGGQDAKYVRLCEGEVYDAAMNEACSAGTGSFIEEQGKKFADVADVVQMSELALAAPGGVSLGQHCSVFMAEVIDAAVSAGHQQNEILAGIYDSIIQNYLNRVKGARSVGERIFCQGMPFASDALASAVARQTGREVIVPPNPGTVGALGISLLAADEIDLDALDAPTEPSRFLEAQVLSKDRFVCKSTRGCGAPGNKCKIDRLATAVAGERKRFLWGGNCSLFDHGTGKKKLPDRAPDPFGERAELVRRLIGRLGTASSGGPVVALTDEFSLKALFPFFATFIHGLGFELLVRTDGDPKDLKRGIAQSNVGACAPLQLYTGLVHELLSSEPDYLLLPIIRDLPRAQDEALSMACPLSQASADLLRKNVAPQRTTRILRPLIDMGRGNLDSKSFIKSCVSLALDLGVRSSAWERAFAAAREAQLRFEAECRALGQRALAFCEARDVIAVIVLGRSYTIYNTVLNSNVPALLREQGAIAIPVDCYPIDDTLPTIGDVYWGHSQLNLRASEQIRERRGHYSLFCSNYSCGPDSFNLHFYAHIMEGKPFSVIETDGHSGDAGTKTRIEAFLYCVEMDRRAGHRSATRERTRPLGELAAAKPNLGDLPGSKRTLLIPPMGPNAEVLAAALRGEGMPTIALPVPDKDALRLGRSYTSGKECVPMTVTLGSLLQHVERSPIDARFAFFMPACSGPCRFGMYNLLDKVILERLGWLERVSVLTQPESNFFLGVSQGCALRVWSAFVAGDLLLSMLHDARPLESAAGAADALYRECSAELEAILEDAPAPSFAEALARVTLGDVFGFCDLLVRAARRFAAIRTPGRSRPTVAIVGEVYARCDPFTNDFLIERLEQRGLRVKLARFGEFIEYSDWSNLDKIADGRHEGPASWIGEQLTARIKRLVADTLYRAVRKPLGWPLRLQIADIVEAAEPYLSHHVHGEAVLALGASILEHQHGEIDGVISIGPHECMPSKIAEAQFYHVAEEKGLIVLALPVNGEPVPTELLDNFAFEVQMRAADTRRRQPTADHRDSP